jgi:pimeloyl-ACP methyl ester carboxylesterase
MKKQTFLHDGLEFIYYQTGSGELDILIQHGYSDSALCWGPLPEDLGKHYHVTLMDARGHGESAKPDFGYDLTCMAKDMLALLNHTGMKKPIIIGHSMGGSLAAHLAALEPERLGGAVLIDPGFRTRTDDQRLAAMADLHKEMNAIKQMSTEGVAEYIRSKHPDWEEHFVNPSARAKLQMSTRVVDIFRTIDATWQDDLKKAICPMLLITADESAGAIVSEETRTLIKTRHPNVKILHIPGAGHSIQREKYSEVLQGILNFIRSL